MIGLYSSKQYSTTKIRTTKSTTTASFFIGVKYFNNQNFKEAIVYFSNSNKYPINDTMFICQIFGFQIVIFI